MIVEDIVSIFPSILILLLVVFFFIEHNNEAKRLYTYSILDILWIWFCFEWGNDHFIIFGPLSIAVFTTCAIILNKVIGGKEEKRTNSHLSNKLMVLFDVVICAGVMASYTSSSKIVFLILYISKLIIKRLIIKKSLHSEE